jgi:rubrerythrin
MIPASAKELLLQSLVHERGGVLLYRAALSRARDPRLHEEWARFLEQTEKHVAILESVCTALGIDPSERTPGCAVVEHLGKALVSAIEMTGAEGEVSATERLACECIVLAETKDQANWDLIGECANGLDDADAEPLRAAYETVAGEEDEHVEHAKEWSQHLWLTALQSQDTRRPPAISGTYQRAR